MPKFGRKSRNQLSTCHEDLQALFEEVVKYFDCSVLEGHRGEVMLLMLYLIRLIGKIGNV
jgi:hypothetical protein